MKKSPPAGAWCANAPNPDFPQKGINPSKATLHKLLAPQTADQVGRVASLVVDLGQPMLETRRGVLCPRMRRPSHSKQHAAREHQNTKRVHALRLSTPKKILQRFPRRCWLIATRVKMRTPQNATERRRTPQNAAESRRTPQKAAERVSCSVKIPLPSKVLQ
jgi:hypothetical protein